ncbi:hypothetical protein FNV43_RR27189 [Rhamnella rubrinervis]|uniref:Uncharacterized protein n=1 Tax=Rhamnella rubrinervis TaxID=2594499 RepID=A0A8K0DQK2_9ROSA|nr:hypothetical protein FNV43_RR27189 [Rhamnella rubrinervis]
MSPFYEDSVPGTPMYKFNNSPRYSEAGNFDNFSNPSACMIADFLSSQIGSQGTRDFNHLSSFLKV